MKKEKSILLVHFFIGYIFKSLKVIWIKNIIWLFLIMYLYADNIFGYIWMDKLLQLISLFSFLMWLLENFKSPLWLELYSCWTALVKDKHNGITRRRDQSKHS